MTPIATPSIATMAGGSVRLRRPRHTDVAERLALGNPPDILHMFGEDPATARPLTEAAARRWVDRLAEHSRAWVIEHDGRLLGEIRLDALDEHDRRARLAIGLYDPAKLGRGVGREAIGLVLRHAFDSLRLHRVGLRVLAFNTRAIRCYLACGFVEEGREREAACVAGTWHDDVLMGILRRDFLRQAAEDRRR